MIRVAFQAIILIPFIFIWFGCTQRGDSGAPVEPGLTQPEPQTLTISAELDLNFMTSEQQDVVRTVFNHGNPLDDVNILLEIAAYPDGSWHATGAVTGLQVTIYLNLQGYYDKKQLENGEIIFFGDLADITGKVMSVYSVPEMEKELLTLTMPHGEDSLMLLTFGQSFPQIEEVLNYRAATHIGPI